MGEHCDQCQVRHTPGLKAPPHLRMAPNPGFCPQTDILPLMQP